MSTEKFEPYGEALPDAGSGTREQPKASAILSAVGQYVFWLLVVVIVLTRIAYFSPVSSFATDASLALTHGTQR
jgi:hypothetical protein